MTEHKPQAWETEEEAMAALHEYASRYAEREKEEGSYQNFLDGHQIFELSRGKYVLALKAGVMPFNYA